LGIETVGDRRKKKAKNIGQRIKKLGKGTLGVVKRTGRGLQIMGEGASKASKSKTGKKIRGSLMNAYNNFYGK